MRMRTTCFYFSQIFDLKLIRTMMVNGLCYFSTKMIMTILEKCNL